MRKGDVKMKSKSKTQTEVWKTERRSRGEEERTEKIKQDFFFFFTTKVQTLVITYTNHMSGSLVPSPMFFFASFSVQEKSYYCYLLESPI